MVEKLTMIASIFSAGAAVGVLWVAWRALHTWQIEVIGTKKIELAAEIMVCVFDFQDILAHVRNNAYYDAQGLEEVFNKNIEITDRLKGLFNKSRVYLSEDLCKLLKELHSFIQKLKDAQKEIDKGPVPCEDPNERDYNDKIRDESLSIRFAGSSENNRTSKVIFKMVEEIRLNLEPLYKDKKIPWKKLEK